MSAPAIHSIADKNTHNANKCQLIILCVVNETFYVVNWYFQVLLPEATEPQIQWGPEYYWSFKYQLLKKHSLQCFEKQNLKRLLVNFVNILRKI